MSVTFAVIPSTGFSSLPTAAKVAPVPSGLLARARRAGDLGSHAKEPAAMCASAAAALAAAAVGARRSKRGRPTKTARRYTTEKINPSFQWLKAGFRSGDLVAGDFRVLCIAGCDICVGKTQGGQLFAVGDKVPPTGLSFSVGAEVEGETIRELQYGNLFNVFDGQPVGDWCPSPPILGGLVGAFMGGPQAVATFDVREGFLGGEVEVKVDTNAKRAYEADYWKGLLDAQGKVDGTYY